MQEAAEGGGGYVDVQDTEPQYADVTVTVVEQRPPRRPRPSHYSTRAVYADISHTLHQSRVPANSASTRNDNNRPTVRR